MLGSKPTCSSAAVSQHTLVLFAQVREREREREKENSLTSFFPLVSPSFISLIHSIGSVLFISFFLSTIYFTRAIEKTHFSISSSSSSSSAPSPSSSLVLLAENSLFTPHREKTTAENHGDKQCLSIARRIWWPMFPTRIALVEHSVGHFFSFYSPILDWSFWSADTAWEEPIFSNCSNSTSNCRTVSKEVVSWLCVLSLSYSNCSFQVSENISIGDIADKMFSYVHVNHTFNLSTKHQQIESYLENFTLDVYDRKTTFRYNGQDCSTTSGWDVASALLFAITVITTIGYGHITPTSW